MSAVLALTALAVAGCGSSAPSKASYVAKANAICDTYNAKAKAIKQPAEGATLSATADFINQTATLGGEETDKLKALKTPKGDGGTVTALYDRQAAQITEIRSVAKQVASGDTDGARAAITKGQTLGESLDKDFDSYGLTSCGSKSG